jgi:hypothetical protein
VIARKLSHGSKNERGAEAFAVHQCHSNSSQKTRLLHHRRPTEPVPLKQPQSKAHPPPG